MSAISKFLAAANLLPHGHCLFWRPDLLLLHVVSDILIALAYFSIPLALVQLLRRRSDLVFNQVFWLFAAFITACGLTHLFNVADIWLAMYPLSGLVKAFTALISLVTAIACWRLLPAATALPSPTQLREEVSRRQHAEAQLRDHNYRLEQKVEKRTAEIRQVNQQLIAEVESRKQLQKRAELLAAVVDWSEDAIARLNKDGIIESWNKGAEALYGYREDEVLGKDISILEDSRSINLNELAQSEPEVGAVSKEVIRLTKAGDYIHVLRTVSPIRHADNGEIIGYASISRSIEDRFKAEQKLSASATHLRKANGDLKDFVYIASHDLQEPLRLISSYLQIIKEDYGDQFDEDGLRYIDYTLQSSQRLQSLITDLLGYSRLNTTQEPLAEVNLDKLIANTVADQQILLQEKNGSVSTEGELPIVSGDNSQLGLVFSNLIGNALKYSADDRPPKITISAKINKDETILCVADNGIGFEPRQAERIFQVFRRLHPPHLYGGTGIGLSICKKVMDRHGGRIWAESEPGVGSQFFFSLPHNIDPDIFNHTEES